MSASTIDYEKTSIRKLFVKQLIPSALGMAFTALFVIVDGVFVGRGIGSDALAAVNIVVPLFTIMTGVGLMFGMGAAIIATIHLSQRKKRSADIIITQSFIISSLIMLLFTILAVCFPKQIAVLLGSPGDLVDMVAEYLIYLSWFSIFQTAISSLPFFVRISSPNYSLFCLTTATVINLVLDYVFIFIFKWGLMGAALATGIGQTTATLMFILYLTKNRMGLRFVKLRITLKNVRYAIRNTVTITRLGFAVLLSEITISIMSLAGNYTFSFYAGVAGIAAFSIINYLFPVVYLIFNAITQSAQPVISYNYGQNRRSRYMSALRLAMGTAICAGFLFVLVCTVFNQQLVSFFIPDVSNQAWIIATYGLPYFSLCFIFFGINIVAIGYYMSIHNIRRAMLFTVIRGVLPILCFILIPVWLELEGIWLSVPIAEILTTLIILMIILKNNYSIRKPCRGRARLS